MALFNFTEFYMENGRGCLSFTEIRKHIVDLRPYEDLRQGGISERNKGKIVDQKYRKKYYKIKNIKLLNVYKFFFYSYAEVYKTKNEFFNFKKILKFLNPLIILNKNNINTEKK